jgi:hypothetical protein
MYLNLTTLSLSRPAFCSGFLYSSVGHGGASGYLATMALFSVSPEPMKSSALLLNVAVSSIAVFRYYRGGHSGGKMSGLCPSKHPYGIYLRANPTIRFPLSKIASGVPNPGYYSLAVAMACKRNGVTPDPACRWACWLGRSSACYQA